MKKTKGDRMSNHNKKTTMYFKWFKKRESSFQIKLTKCNEKEYLAIISNFRVNSYLKPYEKEIDFKLFIIYFDDGIYFINRFENYDADIIGVSPEFIEKTFVKEVEEMVNDDIGKSLEVRSGIYVDDVQYGDVMFAEV